MADPISLASILGAEIMRTGKWNGTKFTAQDLDDIASAAANVGYVPPVKVGHDESTGARAWGWVKNIRKEGDRLIGDLRDIPESLAAIIRERGYDQLSAEIYMDLERDGKSFRRALKAVALLGAEVPAVSGLKPLRELFTATGLRAGTSTLLPSSGYTAKAVCFTKEGTVMSETPTPPGPTPTPPAPVPIPPPAPPAPPPPVKVGHDDAEVARLRAAHATMKAAADAQALELAEQKRNVEAQATEIATLQAANREAKLAAKLGAWKGPPAFRPFFEALYRTAAEAPRTLKFSSEPGKSEEMSLDAVVDKLAEKLATDAKWMLNGQISVVAGTDFTENPGAEVDTRANKLIAADRTLTYKAAMAQVLSADPALKTAYAGGG